MTNCAYFCIRFFFFFFLSSFLQTMSLLDDYMESSEAVHGTPTLQFGADAFLLPNGFDGIESVRVM